MTDPRLQGLATIIATVLQRPHPALTLKTRLRDLDGMDSLRFLETVALAEDHFNTELDITRLESLETIQDLLDALRA